MKAKSRWVWTQQAQQESRGRRTAGSIVEDHWRTDVPDWMHERGLVMDAEDYDYGDGQVDMFEMI